MMLNKKKQIVGEINETLPIIEENKKYLTYFNFLNRTLPLCMEDVKNSLREGRSGINEATFLLACIPESFKKDLDPTLQTEINNYNHKMFILDEAKKEAITKKQRIFILQQKIDSGQSLAKKIINSVINLLDDKNILDPTREPIPTGYISLWEGDEGEPNDN